MQFIGTLCLILVATTLAGHISVRLRLPAVIGQLVVGIILGPALLGWVKADEFIHLFSEIGVIILMFSAGLESDLKLLKKYLTPSISVAFFGVVLPVLGTYLFCMAIGVSLLESIFISVIFSATSVSISVAVLKELNVLQSKAGATILGAAVVDDVLAVVILSVMVSLMGSQVDPSAAHSNLVITFAGQILFFIAIFVLVKWLTPFLTSLAKHLYVSGGPTIVAIILCLSMAYVADLLGLSSVVGAFFAGIAVGQTKVNHEVEANIQPIGYAVFIPVFFVSIGLSMTFTGFMKDLWLIAILTIIAVITKLVGAGFGAKLTHFSIPDAYIVGAGMISRGEMALIIAQIGFDAKLIGPDYYSSIITAVILTTILAPIFLKHAYAMKMEHEPHAVVTED